jgi:signal transduction histidine kinase
VLVSATLVGLLLAISSETAAAIVVLRTWVVGFGALAAFSLFERWPRRLPAWLDRWILQLAGVVVQSPFSALLAYWLWLRGPPPFDSNGLLLAGWAMLTFAGVLFSPWIALGAMLRQSQAFARTQALEFRLEREQLERRAVDARLRLLQAQVEPHFLFNTLANVQALVAAGSPRAVQVLASLIAYLRAAVPRLHDPVTTIGHELQLVRSYLELMQLRMPDRLVWTLDVEAGTEPLECPPMALLTLVENAVRHGIDPAEEGGRIDVRLRLDGSRCVASVADSGIGMQSTSGGLGTGLASLRERLQLAFGGEAGLELSEVEPHGVHAMIWFPARTLPAPAVANAA